MRRGLALALMGVCLCGAESARGELADDVATVAHAWAAAGPVRVLPPRVMQRGDARPVLLSVLDSNAASDDCVTLAVLGAPSATFVLRLATDGRARVAPQDAQRPSVAGLVEVERCGAEKALLGGVDVEMRSPRAVVQAIVVRGRLPAQSVREILPRRDPGMVPMLEVPGPPPASAPLAVRTGAVERRERREGVETTSRRLLRADDSGSGDLLLALGAGCHRLDLFGSGAAGQAPEPVDVDAEVSLPQTGEVLATDRGDSADATTSFCLGGSTSVRLRFAGAVPRSPVLMLQGDWSLPRGLPDYFGADTRARMAEALREHRVKPPTASPVYASMGVSGVTALPIETEPGACYQVVGVVMQGQGGLSLAVTAGDRTSQNRSPDDASGTALAFCAGGADHALVEIESEGPAVVWLTAVWQTGRVALGEAVQ